VAKSMIVTCDIGGEDGARSYTLAVDDERWSIDLGDEHAKPMMVVAERGHRVGNRPPPSGMRNLDSRIRGVPAISDGTGAQ
jgi:hypothetical protein